MEDEYYIAVAGETKGPYSRSQLKTMWDQGLVTCDTQYWDESKRDWYLLSTFFEHEMPGARLRRDFASIQPNEEPPRVVPAEPKEPPPGVGRVSASQGIRTAGKWIAAILVIIWVAYNWRSDPDADARGFAEQFVSDVLSKPSSARFEKTEIIQKEGSAYLFHVVVTASGRDAEREQFSYLVCFKLDGGHAKSRKDLVVSNASDPPTSDEVSIVKSLNGWPFN